MITEHHIYANAWFVIVLKNKLNNKYMLDNIFNEIYPIDTPKELRCGT